MKALAAPAALTSDSEWLQQLASLQASVEDVQVSAWHDTEWGVLGWNIVRVRTCVNTASWALVVPCANARAFVCLIACLCA